jgi:D-xylose 1-dehydrogenase (NADP+, D-xylono-1,5-lactone-forming)
MYSLINRMFFMPDKIRWGILSTAHIGRARVIPAMQKAKNGVVAAVASRDLARAQAFASDLGIKKAYGSYEELINDPEIDAIYNPLPNSEHAEWSIKCAEAGKPTLCEKPLARNADEAQTMVDAFAQRGVLFAEAFMYRFHPRTQRAYLMIRDGAIGEIRSMHSVFDFVLKDEDNIRLSKSLSGGSLMDVGCYCINVMRHMTGEEPERVAAIARVGAQSQVDETLTGLLQFPSGAMGHFDSSLRAFKTNIYDIRGSEGRIFVEDSFTPQPNQKTVIHFWHGEKYEQIKIPATNQYTVMAEDFADALLHQHPPRFAPQDAVGNMRVIDRLLASIP